MSDFHGPNLYYFQSVAAPDMLVNVKGASSEQNTPIFAWKGTDIEASHWSIDYCGVGHTGKPEYHIINRYTGTLLTAQHDFVKGSGLEANVMNPWWRRSRWCITPTRDGDGSFWIVSAGDPNMMMNIDGSKEITLRTPIILWNTRHDANSKWLIKMANDAIPNGREPNT